MKKTLLALLISFSLFSCDKDEDSNNDVNTEGLGKVFIAHEGNFGSANAEIGLWDLATNSFTADIYNLRNDEVFGDTFQSFYVAGERIFWVINNSGKIVVTDQSFNKLGEINGLISPRYFVPIDENYAYVTDYFSGVITVVNHQTYTVSHTIPVVVEWTEKAFVFEGSAYVIGKTLIDNVNYIYDYSVVKVNLFDETVSYIDVPFSVSDADTDELGNLWLVGSDSDFSPLAYTLDMSSDELNMAVNNFAGSSLAFVRVNNSNENVYGIVDGDIYELDRATNSTSLVSDLDLTYVYGFDVNQNNNDMYVLDASDFSGNGTAVRINEVGEISSQIEVGIIPKAVLVP
ncbi:MAG: hypothetical protein QNL21_05945 [Flavobacteriales bacterium]|jgi:hypothetical protein